MTVAQAMQARRSIRSYTDEAVSREDIDRLLHAAMSGPSACNTRPWEFYCVTNPDKVAALYGATRYSKIKAPLAIVVCGNTHKALPMQLAPYWIQDCSAAAENILLQAVELELGTVWCGIHPQKTNEKHVREILDLPEHIIPLGLIWVGHPAETQPPRDQYDEKKVHFVE